VQYASYHHFRSRGWVVRSGLLYGIDWVLYQRHPAHAHSDYGVIVVPLPGPPPRGGGEGEGVPPPGGAAAPPAWTDAGIAHRLLGQVSKELLLLYVRPEAGVDWGSPEGCLGRLAVEERLMHRWAPATTR